MILNELIKQLQNIPEGYKYSEVCVLSIHDEPMIAAMSCISKVYINKNQIIIEYIELTDDKTQEA